MYCICLCMVMHGTNTAHHLLRHNPAHTLHNHMRTMCTLQPLTMRGTYTMTDLRSLAYVSSGCVHKAPPTPTAPQSAHSITVCGRPEGPEIERYIRYARYCRWFRQSTHQKHAHNTFIYCEASEGPKLRKLNPGEGRNVGLTPHTAAGSLLHLKTYTRVGYRIMTAATCNCTELQRFCPCNYGRFE